MTARLTNAETARVAHEVNRATVFAGECLRAAERLVAAHYEPNAEAPYVLIAAMAPIIADELKRIRYGARK